MKSDRHNPPPGNHSPNQFTISDNASFALAAQFLLDDTGDDLADVTSRLTPTILQAIATATSIGTYDSKWTTTPTTGSSPHDPLSAVETITTTTPTLVATSTLISNTTSSDVIDSFYFYETEQFVFLWILFTVIVLGNTAVLVTLFFHRSRKSRMNFFIKQLALADLSVGILNVLTDIIWRITIEWRAGNLACKLIKFLQTSVTFASTYVLVALSIDRYDAITHPMNFSGSWRRARRLVAAAWALSAFFSLPMFYLYEIKLIEKQTQCWIELDPSSWKVYMSLVSTVLFLFPALIISACYAIIIRTIWAKGAILGHSERRIGSTGGGSLSSDDRASRRASSRGIIPRAKVKTVKMTIVIVVVFILCWSPYIIFDLLQVFEQIPKTQTNIAIATFIQSLAPLNSAANPLIYCLFSTEVCRNLRRLPPFRWLASSKWCCKGNDRSNAIHSRCGVVGGPRLLNSQDSVRTLTTSLAVSTRRGTMNSCNSRQQRVTIVERPKTIIMSEV